MADADSPLNPQVPADAAPENSAHADAPTVRRHTRAEGPHVLPAAHEHTLLDHLGLPFFYRHAPTAGLRRGAFWALFIVTGGILFFNVLFMPHEKNSVMYVLRATLFSTEPAYRDYEEGARGLSDQFFVLALILCGILSPLYAAFSLCSERVSGTMEFLRLAPLSSVGVVIGKMFAPAHPLLLVAGGYLLLGNVCGALGGRNPGALVLATATIVMSCATLHALGAFFAALTTIFRGFGSLAGLLFFGGMMCTPPIGASYERGMEFMGFISPWAALDALFWRSPNRRWGWPFRADFFGSESLVHFYIFGFHLLLCWLLILAASRKLDNPDRPALPKRCWLLLWGFALLTASGLVSNLSQFTPTGPNANRFGSTWWSARAWEHGALVMIVSSIGICILALLDHPHDRNSTLAQECERIAGGQASAGRDWRRLAHAIFVSGLVLASAVTVVIFLSYANELNDLPSGQITAFIAAPVLFVLLVSLALETASIGYASFLGRSSVAVLSIIVLLASMLTPLIHFSLAQRRFRIVTLAGEDLRIREYEAARAANPGLPLPPGVRPHYRRNWVWNDEQFRPYLEGITTAEQAAARVEEFREQPLKMFGHFHPTASVVYPVGLAGLIALVVYRRRRAYNALHREARKAVEETGEAPAAATG